MSDEEIELPAKTQRLFDRYNNSAALTCFKLCHPFKYQDQTTCLHTCGYNFARSIAVENQLRKRMTQRNYN